MRPLLITARAGQGAMRSELGLRLLVAAVLTLALFLDRGAAVPAPAPAPAAPRKLHDATDTAPAATYGTAPAYKHVGRGASLFKDQKVLRVLPSTEEQVRGLRQYLADHPTLDAWLEPTAPGRAVDVRVAANDTAAFEEFLAEQGLAPKDMIGDLGRLIDEEQRQMDDSRRSNPEFGWDNYHTLEEIHKWMQDLVQKYPNEASLIDVGRSYEGRAILGIKIKSTEENAPIVFFEAGIHAREWITPATATYLINEILTRDGDGDAFKAAMRAYEWHIFPSTNPDGYHYTHTVNRLWRKSRSKYSYICQGADLNRNWPFHWREVGASSSPCSETYAGVRAESEVETKALKRYLDSLLEKPDAVRVYISLHSYSQLLMYPWGYTSQLPKNHVELNGIAAAAVQAAAKRHGTKFKHGPIATTIYPASGSTLDYAYEKGVRFPFVFELRDEGNYGFLLPKDQIKPSGEETVDAIAAIVTEAKRM